MSFASASDLELLDSHITFPTNLLLQLLLDSNCSITVLFTYFITLKTHNTQTEAIP